MNDIDSTCPGNSTRRMTKEEIETTAKLIGLRQLLLEGEISINQARDVMGCDPLTSDVLRDHELHRKSYE